MLGKRLQYKSKHRGVQDYHRLSWDVPVCPSKLGLGAIKAEDIFVRACELVWDIPAWDNLWQSGTSNPGQDNIIMNQFRNMHLGYIHISKLCLCNF